MEVVTKIITIMGGLVAIGGLGWCFIGSIDFFQGKKNQNAQQTDNGIASMIYGGGIAAVASGIAAAIVQAINAIHF